MIEQLPTQQRLDWLGHLEHGAIVQRALLAGADLTDDELLACLPEITRSVAVTAGRTPPLIDYVGRYPRVVDLAKSSVAMAVADLIANGWSPTTAAQAGRWADLTALAAVAETAELIDELSSAAVFDCAKPATVTTHNAPWRDPLRYEFVDRLMAKTATTDKQITYILDRLSTSHIAELQQSAGKRSRLLRLTTAALAARLPGQTARPVQQTRWPKLPSDDELSTVDSPEGALLELWRNRASYRTREEVADRILDSQYATDDLAWRLPIVDLERHAVWGPRLAGKIVDICGESPARWQEFTRSWNQPTQLLASTLFTRLEKAAD